MGAGQEAAPESWPNFVGRVVMSAPGESWSALSSVPVYVRGLSEAAAGALWDSPASEHLSRLLLDVPSTVVRHVQSAVWQSRGSDDDPGDCVSAAEAPDGRGVSPGGGVGHAGKSVARLALMVGALVPASAVAVPKIAWSAGVGRLTKQGRQPPPSTAAPIEHEHGGAELGPPLEAPPGAEEDRREEEQEQAAAMSALAAAAAAAEGFRILAQVTPKWRFRHTDDDTAASEQLEKAAAAGDTQDLATAAALTTSASGGCALPQFVPYSAQTPWHTGPRAFFSAVFPRYGNYCGPNWSSGRSSGSLSWDKPPVDHLDHCCYCHDMGYDSHDQRDLHHADLKLLRCLETTPERERWVKGTARLSVAGVYRVLCILGLRSFLIPYRKELIRRIEAAESRDLFALKRTDLQDTKHQ